MTQDSSKEYPAHEKLREMSEGYQYATLEGQPLIDEFTALLAAQPSAEDIIKELAVILPDDAEPQKGDLCWHKNLQPMFAGYSRKEWEEYKPMNEYPFTKIIQRNGKPVIYEAALRKAQQYLGEGK